MTAYPGLGVTGNGVGVVTPTAHKLAQSGLIVKTGGAANAIRAGVFYGGTDAIVSGTGTMSYNVGAFTAALSRGGSSGTVLLANDGTVNIATTAAPGSNSRIDTVYVWQREFSLDGTDSNPVIGVAQGTAAASPTAPSLAAFPGALALANITVPAGVTATNTGTTIAQVAPFTATAGGIIAFRTTTERDAATVGLNQKCVVLSNGAEYQKTASGWRTLNFPKTAFTPSWTNLTIGSGSNTGFYKIVNGECFGEIVTTLGSGLSVGAAAFTLPVTADIAAASMPVGQVNLLDTGSGNFVGTLLWDGARAAVQYQPAAFWSAVSSTAPFTWAAGDSIRGSFRYPVA